MTTQRPETGPGSIPSEATRNVDDIIPVRIWDWPVRAVHWAITVLVVVSITTGLVGGGAMEWHLRSGFAVLALTLFRVLWGFVGSAHARFANFVRGPRAVREYARSLFRPPRAAYAGHNPLGAWFVVFVLVALLVQGATGLFANDDIATEGPLAKFVSDAVSDRLTWLHARGAWVVVGIASIHVGAVFYYLVALRENLIGPMLTGIKQLPRQLAGAAIPSVASLRAIVLAGVCALVVWAIARL